MTHVTVEFSGLAQVLVGKTRLPYEFPAGATYRDLVRRLAQDHPALIDVLITPDGQDFLSSNMFVVDGDLVNPVMLLDQPIQDGQNLHLMSVITGG